MGDVIGKKNFKKTATYKKIIKIFDYNILLNILAQLKRNHICLIKTNSIILKIEFFETLLRKTFHSLFQNWLSLFSNVSFFYKLFQSKTANYQFFDCKYIFFWIKMCVLLRRGISRMV